MSNLYAIRRKYKTQAKETEREYSAQTVKGASQFFPNMIDNIVNTATSGFNKAMAAATRRRELEMRMARQGITADTLGQYGEESLSQAAGTVQTGLSPITGMMEQLIPNLGVTEAIMQSPVGRRGAELVKEYPRTAKNVGNALEAGSFIPAAKFGGRFINALADNMPTEMPGFYSGNQVGAVTKAVGGAVVPTMGQLFGPSAQATRNTIGTGAVRAEEYVNNPKQSVTTGTMLASSHMGKQQSRSPDGPDDVVQNSAETQRYVQDSVDVSDTEAIRAGLASLEPDTPDVVLDAAMNHWKAVHNIDRSAGGTTAVIRRPLSGEKLSGEAVGTASTASPVARSLTSQVTLGSARKALPDSEGKDFYSKYLTIAQYANNNRVRKAVSDGKLSKNTTSSGVQQDYWKGLANQNNNKKVTANQQAALDFFDKARPIKMTDRGDGIYTFQDVTASAAQDLGGMNAFGAIDVNKGQVWIMGSDGHDLVGMKPPGNNDLVNLVPIHSFKVGEKRKYDSPEKTQVDLSRIEEITGIPKQKKESATAYQKRVLRDYKGTANLSDYMAVGNNLIGAGMLTTTVGQANNEE